MSSEASGNRFSTLHVKGFRRLNEIHLDLQPLTVIIGANGSGKTSVLDVLSLLADSAQGILRQSISDLSGLPSVLTYDHAEALELGISMEVPDKEDWLYLLRLRLLGQGYEIDEESLNQGGILYIMAHPSVRVDYYDADQGRTIHPNWEYVPFETSLSQVPKMFRGPEDFRKRLASSTLYRILNLRVEPRSPLRLPQPIQPAILPGHNGEELVSCLFYLRETERDRFEAIEDVLRAAFPAFDRLEFQIVGNGILALLWREKGFSKPFYMNQLSEGTLRFLWLATLLASPGLTALTLLDEPEVSMHPELLNLLADLFREASRRTQLVVATHSDRLIRFLKPEEVVVIDSDEDGMSTLTWADKLDLVEWLKDYSLDELWSNGRIGARP
jgi:predicted ATPase